MKRGMALYKREKEETHWFLLLSFLIPASLIFLFYFKAKQYFDLN